MADGKLAAVSIDKNLAGKKAILEYDPEQQIVDIELVLNRTADRERAWRPIVELAPGEKRVKTFSDTTRALSRAKAVTEAQRCLACGCGAGCEICKDICMAFCYTLDKNGKTELEEDSCLACGMCIHRCPNDNVEMFQTGTENLV